LLLHPRWVIEVELDAIVRG